jgi:uncharacterized membrane protein
MDGYRHSLYADSLKEFGLPRYLSACDGWILERQINGSDLHDAMGCYPLFACGDWHNLGADMRTLSDHLVSLTIVTDPFGNYVVDDLQQSFNKMVIPFKEHLVLDLNQPIEQTTSKRHRKKARSALKSLQVEMIEDAVSFLDEWTNLYNHLIERHHVTGIRAFSRESFAKQLAIPGTVAVRVSHQGITVGAQIIIFQEDVAHCHLAAYTPEGYDMNASYASDYLSIEYCATRARWYNLGGGVGSKNDEQDGLTWYKSGWSSETRMSYLCGHIFNQSAYDNIVAQKAIEPTNYFPAYRVGEFG